MIFDFYIFRLIRPGTEARKHPRGHPGTRRVLSKSMFDEVNKAKGDSGMGPAKDESKTQRIKNFHLSAYCSEKFYIVNITLVTPNNSQRD